MTKTSATGGYLAPTTETPMGSLTLAQFLQTAFVGVSGLDATLVRPRWQRNPPPNPPVETNWLAIGIMGSDADTNAFTGADKDGNFISQRNEELQIQCAFYGPLSQEYAGIVRDGFQIPQNSAALRAANMTFAFSSKPIHAPDLINEQWVDKWEMTVIIRRTIRRSYPILSFLSVNGSVKAQLSAGTKTIAWNAEA